MTTALTANNDVSMIKVLQIMHCKMLKHALECIVKDGWLDSKESTVVLSSSWQEAGKGNG